MKRFTSFAAATLAALALVLGSVTAPAFAEEPTPTPTATDEPTPQPTVAPDPTATPEPTETPTATPTPTPSGAVRGGGPSVAPPGTQDVTGHITELGDQLDSGSVKVFTVPGEGYLSIDFAGVTLTGDPSQTRTVRLAIPAGVAADASGLVPFSTLAGVTSPLVATDLVAPSFGAFGADVLRNDSMVNQTPAETATHLVFAVPVTPANVCGASCSVTASQSLANIQADVNAADSYWLSQSDGKVGFDLAGSTAWYKSAYSCDANTPTNFANLLNEASIRAAAQIGYAYTENAHLVLVFPSGSNCGPAVGIGTIGSSINEGGGLWVIGSGQSGAVPTEYHTLAHELGHNLSLGHANWLDCTSATPAPGPYGTTGCTIKHYGDAADVMGQGDGIHSQGSLSSPSAIRSGLWSPSSYTTAPNGTSNYTLKPLSSATGLRSVVVEGNNGVNYYVEFRDTAGIDSSYALGCPFYTGLCAPTTAGVRILQLEQQSIVADGSTFEFKGFPGDDSLLVGRTVSGVKRVNLVAGESLTIAGMTVSVTGITGAGAAVSITRTGASTAPGSVYIMPTAGSGSSWPWYAGDTLTAMLTSGWQGADSYKYQWYLNTNPIPGATSQNYTLTTGDVYNNIGVKVTSYIGTVAQSTRMDPDLDLYLGYGPIAHSIGANGAVAIDSSTLPFTAVPSGWLPNVTFSYLWYRNGTVITGASGSTYTPVALDDGASLKVRVTATRSGYPTKVAFSEAKNYTLSASGSVSVAGSLRVGLPLTVNSGLAYSTVDGPVSPTFTYQWYRSGVAIAGATASTYTLAAADLGATMTVRVNARAAGYASNSVLSSATTAVLRGNIAGSLAAPEVAPPGASLNLAVTLPFGSVTEPGVAYLYQWYRNGTPVPGATLATYQLTTADHGKDVSARVIVTKGAFNSATLYSSPVNYSVTASGPVSIVGTAQVGLTVSASSLTYETAAGPASPTLSYVWYRNGVAILGATGSSYTLVAADFGTSITVRAIASITGYISSSQLSPAAVAVKGVLTGDFALPVVTKDAALKLTAALPSGSVTESVTPLYQWLRNGVAIVGATASTFQLTAADYGKNISVTITATKPNYTSVALTSVATNYSVAASGSLTVDGVAQVGLTVAPSALSYSTSEGAVTPALAYVWYRNGIAIVGATASTYTLVAADFGTKISVRVTATLPGFLSHQATSPMTAYAVKGVLTGDFAVPTVTKSPSLLLTATLPSGSVNESVTPLYQWLRNGVAIVGATTSTFQLTAADYGKNISVTITATKLNYTSVALTSVATNYSVAASGTLTVDGVAQVGLTVAPSALSYSTSEGAVTPALAYVWYRNGVAIPLATASTYTLVAADFGTKISVRVTATLPGFLMHQATSPMSAYAVKGVLSGDFAIAEVTKGADLKLTAPDLAPTTITDTGVTVTRQWLRDGVAIAGATASTFQLTAADYGKNINVRYTATKLNYTTVTLTTDPINYSLVPSLAVPEFSGYTSTELPLMLVDRSFTAGGVPVTPDTVTYQWLRNGVAIAGATGVSYTPTTPDIGTKISARVTASLAGYLTSISTTASTQNVGTGGTMVGVSDPALVQHTAGSLVLTAVPSITGPGNPADTFQWLRDGAAIVGAISQTYTLTAADYGKAISVRITSTLAPFTPWVATSAAKNYSVLADGSLALSGTAQVGQTLAADSSLIYSTVDGAVTPSLAYVWYRNGVAIAGATSSSYTLVAADFGTKLSVRVTASEPGFIAHQVTSAQSATVVKGVFTGDFAVPTVSSGAALWLTAALPSGSVNESVTLLYQWLRNGVAIVGATGVKYQLTAADYGKTISVTVTATKLNYTSVALTSVPVNYSIAASGSLTVDGVAQVGVTVAASALSYSTADGAVTPTLAYVWYRNGIAIVGATASTYTLVAADFGTKISVRVTATLPGFLSHQATSPMTAYAVKGVLTGDFAVPVVTKDAALKLTAALPSGSVNEPVTPLYQWLRNGVAIVGATASTFQLTAADYGKNISVTITATKLNYTSVALTSVATNYSVAASGTLTVDGVAQVGLTVAPSALSYSTSEGAVTPALAYVWYRNGVAIPLATASTYTLVAADFGTKISVRVTATLPGFLSHQATSPMTAYAVKGVLSGDFALPEVQKNAASLVLTAPDLAPTSITDTGVTVTRQWLRDGVAIVGATASTFQLTAADYGKNINVRYTATKLNYTTVTLTTDPINYSVIRSQAVPLIGGPVERDEVIYEIAGSYTAGGDLVTPTVTYQWLRNGVAIALATSDSYTVVAADMGFALSLRVTATVPGFLPAIATSASTQLVAANSFANYDQPATVQKTPGTTTLTAVSPIVDGTPAYQWYRDGVAIVGAIGASYTATAVDYGKLLHVRITKTKPMYTTAVAYSQPLNYSVAAAGSLTVTGTAQVGQTVAASTLAYTTVDGAVTPTLTYLWYRNGVAIAGATSSSYTLVAADFGTKLTVRVTASEPGFIAHQVTSAQSATVAKGVLTGDFAVPVVTKDAALKLTAALPSGSVNESVTPLYQWLRNGVAIVGATASTFQLTAADYGKSISVTVTATKLNYTSVALTSIATNYSVAATGALTVDGTLQVGLTVAPSALSYSTSDGAVTPSLAYVWYRNGVAIPLATASTYTLVAADFGTKISVRVTATLPGFLMHQATSPMSAYAVKGVMSGSFAVPTVTKGAGLLLTASLPAGSITDAGVPPAWQWLRNGVAIVGATASTFQLTAADYGKSISVTYTAAKLNYTTVVLTSAATNYSVAATGSLLVSETARVGVTLSANALSYSTSEGAVSPVIAYQWLRNGLAIAGATASTYALVAADFGTKTSVRVTANEPGYLAHVVTSPQTATVVAGILSGDLGTPTLVSDPVTTKLTAALAAGSVTDAGIAVAYQWFRDGVAIVGATAASYTPIATDYGHELRARLVVTKLNYTTVTLNTATVIP